MTLTEADVRNAIATVLDPEINLSVLDLGLVYGIDIVPAGDKSKVTVRMTLTTPACPYGPALMGQVYAAVNGLAGVAETNVDLVWVPPWDPRKMASDEAKMQMGFFDMEDEGGGAFSNPSGGPS